MSPSSIPAIDLHDIESGDPARMERAARALLHGFGELGLVTISNHGIDSDELEAFYRDFLALTDRPDSAKRELNRSDIWYQRGWTPPNTERAVVAGGQPDFKECYFIAPEPMDPTAAALYPQLMCPNVWPNGLPAFKDRYLAIGQAVHRVGMQLLRAAEVGLELPEGTLTRMTKGAAHVSRALRYLPVEPSAVDAGVLWGEEHTDFNMLTLLAGGRFLSPAGEFSAKPDPEAGLYLRTRQTSENPNGELVPGRAPAGHIVAQVGQQLEILTGGRFHATPHVIKPPRAEGWYRTSFAHFVHAHPTQMLTPLPGYQSEHALEAYRPPVLAGTYAIKTLVDIGLAPSDTLNSLGYRHYERLATIRADEAT